MHFPIQQQSYLWNLSVRRHAQGRVKGPPAGSWRSGGGSSAGIWRAPSLPVPRLPRRSLASGEVDIYVGIVRVTPSRLPGYLEGPLERTRQSARCLPRKLRKPLGSVDGVLFDVGRLL